MHLTGRNSVYEYESFGTYHHGAGHIQSKIALDPLRGRYLRYRYEFFEGFPVKKLNSYYCEMEHATSPNFDKDKIIKLVFQNWSGGWGCVSHRLCVPSHSNMNWTLVLWSKATILRLSFLTKVDLSKHINIDVTADKHCRPVCTHKVSRWCLYMPTFLPDTIR